MRYLKKYNEAKKYNPSLEEFISELDKELEMIGFSIRHEKEGDDIDIIEIGEIIDFNNSTYLDFYHDSSLGDGFSIKALKKECNEGLDDKSTWECSDEVKDKYDLLCMTILTFIDEKNYGKIIK